MNIKGAVSCKLFKLNSFWKHFLYWLMFIISEYIIKRQIDIYQKVYIERKRAGEREQDIRWGREREQDEMTESRIWEGYEGENVVGYEKT